MENYYTLSGYGGMALSNIEVDHLGVLAMITNSLMSKSHGQNVQSISNNHLLSKNSCRKVNWVIAMKKDKSRTH